MKRSRRSRRRSRRDSRRGRSNSLIRKRSSRRTRPSTRYTYRGNDSTLPRRFLPSSAPVEDVYVLEGTTQTNLRPEYVSSIRKLLTSFKLNNPSEIIQKLQTASELTVSYDLIRNITNKSLYGTLKQDINEIQMWKRDPVYALKRREARWKSTVAALASKNANINFQRLVQEGTFTYDEYQERCDQKSRITDSQFMFDLETGLKKEDTTLVVRGDFGIPLIELSRNKLVRVYTCNGTGIVAKFTVGEDPEYDALKILKERKQQHNGIIAVKALPDPMCFIVERASTDVHHLVFRRHGAIPLSERKQVVRLMIDLTDSGVFDFLVKKCGIMHCDIKLANLMYFPPDRECIKLGDFGLCNMKTSSGKFPNLSKEGHHHVFLEHLRNQQCSDKDAIGCMVASIGICMSQVIAGMLRSIYEGQTFWWEYHYWENTELEGFGQKTYSDVANIANIYLIRCSSPSHSQGDLIYGRNIKVVEITKKPIFPLNERGETTSEIKDFKTVYNDTKALLPVATISTLDESTYDFTTGTLYPPLFTEP